MVIIFPKLMMFIVENVPPSLRGELTKWMLQLKPGVFLGTLSTLVGEKLWNKIQNKKRGGGAIWIKSFNNEQRFKLISSGKTRWSIRDFDGLQLITQPHKKSIKKKNVENQKMANSFTFKQLKKKAQSSSKTQKIPKIDWDTQNTPKDLITRNVKLVYEGHNCLSNFSGTSAYGEYPPQMLWEKPWVDDIKKIVESILSFLNDIENLTEHPYNNKKIMSLDIETTDYLPKAYEGFVNIIGVGVLDLRKDNKSAPYFELFQVFNMTRKKKNVPLLLGLIEPYLNDVDILLVFNKNFDIKILNSVIKEFSLEISLPSNIIDLQDFFPSLKVLEEFLKSQVNVQRQFTIKNKYSEYYKSFKGKGKEGYNKQIEPIGTYNMTDVLTPLYAYLILNQISKNNKLDNNI